MSISYGSKRQRFVLEINDIDLIGSYCMKPTAIGWSDN
ncbi:hypothetical protein M2353_000133 [Bacillus aerius]|nr:hypothetical protein [Bacillus aerius]